MASVLLGSCDSAMSFRLSASGGSPEHVEGPPCYSNNTHIYDMVVLLNPESMKKRGTNSTSKVMVNSFPVLIGVLHSAFYILHSIRSVTPLLLHSGFQERSL
jgi:hypothetical protein